MSGPIFICDAQRVPLMPAAPAHARLLLARGDAQRVPHHAFTIIQLTRSFKQPIVRPVLLHITFHWHTIRLFLLVEQRRGILGHLMLLIERRQAGWLHHIDPYQSHTMADTLEHKVRHPRFSGRIHHPDLQGIHRLTQVITYLRMLIPLSHIVLDATAGSQHVPLSLVTDASLGGLECAVLSQFEHSCNPSPIVAKMLYAVRQTDWSSIPLFYASTTMRTHIASGGDAISSIHPLRQVIHSTSAIPDQLLLMYHWNSQVQTGIVSPQQVADPSHLWVPTVTEPNHIIWRRSPLPQAAKRWPVRTEGIVFIRLRRFTS